MKSRTLMNGLELALIHFAYVAADLKEIDSRLPNQPAWDDFKSSFHLSLAANQILFRSLANLALSERPNSLKQLAS